MGGKLLTEDETGPFSASSPGENFAGSETAPTVDSEQPPSSVSPRELLGSGRKPGPDEKVEVLG